MATTQQPDYFVPAPSWWPFKGAVALFGIGLGAALLVNSVPFSWVPLAIGIAILLWMLFGWFGDVIRESEGGVYSKRVDISFRWGMGWFIFSEVMFFAAFFGTLYYLRSISVPELGNMEHKILWPDFKAMWPMSVAPNGTEPYQVMGPWGLPAWNTLILLTSGVTLTWAHWGMMENKRGQLKLGLLLTVLLGALFLGLQVYEYAHAWGDLGLTMASGVYGASFYMMTGFHGMHVFIGALMLAVMYFRSVKGHFTAEHHFAFEAAAWYWHFVDVVWLILFVFVYWL
ncbi:cytochrome c oxidase subunit 3 [Chitinimonas viridis]|uniref:cytochrome-c oxidase n=2 Tax=Chitinimonas TaxID=240411 RepID=A0ABT8B3I4_9NEIS|nr:MULTISPECIES: cytochrome c oxidase subunit 3 [Chitinimonas]MDN3576555.1 cytochrome c oxidase subunit 3 [Chitinimonas viridis]GLR11492.1 MFS transporter [Chitinimonas prasina]